VPGTILARRPALPANRAAAVPSADTARKKACVPCFGAASGTVARDDTARHKEATRPLRAGPNRARVGRPVWNSIAGSMGGGSKAVSAAELRLSLCLSFVSPCSHRSSTGASPAFVCQPWPLPSVDSTRRSGRSQPYPLPTATTLLAADEDILHQKLATVKLGARRGQPY
jgi:hypothetical protein